MRRLNALGLVLGTAFAFLIVMAGMSEPDNIHDMMLLRKPDFFLAMASAIATAAPLLWLLQRFRYVTPLGGPLTISRSRVQRNHVLGAAVFGTGWALSGTCPVPALAMTAGGAALGGLVMLGLWAGLLLREALVARSQRKSHAAPAHRLGGTLVEAMPTKPS